MLPLGQLQMPGKILCWSALIDQWKVDQQIAFDKMTTWLDATPLNMIYEHLEAIRNWAKLVQIATILNPYRGLAMFNNFNNNAMKRCVSKLMLAEVKKWYECVTW